MDYKKITGESTKDEKKRSVGLMDKIKLNELEYKSPLYSAPVSLRNVRQFPFAQSSYSSGQTMLANLQTSSFYLDGRNSRLEFTIEFTGTATEVVSLGQGSALNVVKSVVLTSRSGTEISRLNSVNLFAAKTHRFTKSKDWFDTEGTLVGYHQEHITIPAGGTISHKFAIPLPMISGFFAPLNSQYLPPYISSGLRIEIQLATSNEALHRTTANGNAVSYRIVDPVLVCDLCKMSDRVDQVMTSVAHKAGLDIVFDEYDTFSVVTSSQKNTIDINKTASKAERVIVCSRTATHVSSLSEDGMMSENYAVNEYQARVGSVYHPQTAITEKVSAYANALQLFKGMRKDERSYPQASLGTFSLHATDNNNVTTGGYAVLGTNLSRSSLIDSQCVPLNNSHSLSLSIGFNSVADRQIDAFLVYKKVCKCFTNNAIIYE